MNEDYKKRIAEQVGEQRVAPDYARHSGIYFFLSLDLVNSTAYKAEHADWKFRTRMFYDDARNRWSNYNLGFKPRVWKYAGDEVLFYARVRSIDQIQNAVEASYKAMRDTSQTVEAWTRNARTRLYVKGACWAAYAAYTEPSSADELTSVAADTYRNLIFQPTLGSGDAAPVLDFLGPEIDAGFRISGGSMKNALVVSAEVANAIWSEGVRAHGNRLRIVDFRELKGVWGGRHYPLIWYREDWGRQELEKDYEYDDSFRSELLRKAYDAAPDSVGQVASILRQVGRAWLVGTLPAKEETREDELDDARVRAPVMEVHCVAVCFDDSGRVLLAKRKTNKTVFADCWEAGCAQLQAGEDFYSAMSRDYLADFGLTLDFAPFRAQGAIGSYSFAKEGRTIPGVIFVARVADPSPLRPAKHAEARWVKVSEVEGLVKTAMVDDLTGRVRRAYDVWQGVRDRVASAQR